MKAWIWAAAAAVSGVFLVAPISAIAQVPAPIAGEAVFNARCKSCHEPAVGRAPSRVGLSAYATGSDRVQAS